MRLTSLLTEYSDKVFGNALRRSALRPARALNTPVCFIEMLLLVEDKRFFSHAGVDPLAIIRAAIFNLNGSVLQGASTIVQQLYRIRTGRQGHWDRSLRMKVYQAVWALLQSLSKSKTALLREYLDGVYWGRSLRGLDQAARIYFNVSRAELSPAQSFFLAERIATPNRFRANRLRALLDRHAIQEAFHRYKITRDEIVNLYRQCDGLGDDVWQLLAK